MLNTFWLYLPNIPNLCNMYICENNRTSGTLAELIFLAFFKLSIVLNPDQYQPVSPDMLLWAPIVILKLTLSFPSCFENTCTDIHATGINFS